MSAVRSVTTTALGACLSKKSGRKRQVPALRFLENGPQGGRRRGLHRPGSPLSPMSSSSSPEGVGGRSGKYEVLEDEPNRRGRGRMRALAPVDQEGQKGDIVVREGPRLSRSAKVRVISLPSWVSRRPPTGSPKRWPPRREVSRRRRCRPESRPRRAARASAGRRCRRPRAWTLPSGSRRERSTRGRCARPAPRARSGSPPQDDGHRASV